MKKEKELCTMRRMTPAILITIAAIFIFTDSSFGKSNDCSTNGGKVIAVQQNPQPAQKDIPFVQVDEMPVFPGGDTALLKYIGNNTVYPEAAKKKGITGKVIIRFIVEKDCSVSEPEILKSVDPLLDAEAIKVINSLPRFEKPAKNNGVPVRVFYMLPITFALN
jgi:periplasmic protein TonB